MLTVERRELLFQWRWTWWLLVTQRRRNFVTVLVSILQGRLFCIAFFSLSKWMGYKNSFLMKKNRQMNNFEKLYIVLHNTGCNLAIYQMIVMPTLANEALLVLSHLTFFALSRATSDHLMTISFYWKNESYLLLFIVQFFFRRFSYRRKLWLYNRNTENYLDNLMHLWFALVCYDTTIYWQ